MEWTVTLPCPQLEVTEEENEEEDEIIEKKQDVTKGQGGKVGERHLLSALDRVERSSVQTGCHSLR